MTLVPALSVRRLRLAALVLAVAALGAALAHWAYRREDRRLRDELLAQTRCMAETIPLDRLQVLHGNLSDEQKPPYRRLKEQLMAAQQIDPDWEWIYLMGRRRNGVVYFQMDSEAFDAPDPSPPGQFYPEASPLLHKVFDKRIAATEGPISDRWGTWVSAFVPLIDPKTDRLVTVVGIDVEASAWRSKAFRATLVPGLATAGLLLLLAFGSRMLGQRNRQPERFRRRGWRHLEALLAAAVGLILTGTGTWMARLVETTHAQEAFGALAQIRTERILDAFLNLRRSELEGLARFIEGSEHVTSREFQRYARHLIRVPEVVAWAWVPIVEEAQRAAFEQAVRDAGWQAPEYRIWDAAADGQTVPAAARPCHYPIYHVESGEALSKYGIAPGRDLAALPAIRETIETARQHNLTAATDVLPPLPGATSPRNQILVFRPVRQILPRGPSAGFAMASVDPQSFLRSFLGENPEENTQVALDLLSLRPGEAPRRLATAAPPEFSADLPARLTDPWTISRPILAFGRTYAVAARPTAAFLAYHTFHLGGLVLLAGLSLTAAGALILGFTVHRREDLARLAEQQAVALAESSYRFALLAEQNRIALWQIDAAGTYTEVSDVFASLSGYAPEDLVGRMHFYDLTPADAREKMQAAALATIQRGEPIRDLIHPVQTRAGGLLWAQTSGIPLRNERGEVTGYWGTSIDVTERRRNEERLAELARENQLAARRYAALIRASNTGAWEYDARTQGVWCSPEYFSMLGYDPAAFAAPEKQTLAVCWLDLLHPGDRETAQDYLDRYVRQPDRPYDCRFRLRRLDGTWAWIWSRGQMLADAAGQPTGMVVGTHIDVTENMRAEEALRESERRYRMLAENMKDVVWIADVDTLRFLYVSPSIEALRGYTPAEVMAGPLADVLLPGTFTPVRDTIAAQAARFRRGEIDSRTFFTLDLRQPRKHGDPIDVEAIVRFWHNDRTGRLELHGVSRDVTERKRAEEDYRTLFQNMLEGFALHEIVADEHGEPRDYRFLAVNPAFERMTGLNAADLLGRTAREALPGLEDKWIEIYGNVVRTGLPAFFEDYSTPLGRSFEVTAFRSGPNQFASIFSDVTERKLALDELRESRRRYLSLLANLPGMAYRCRNDRDWTMEFVSQGCLDLTGYAPEELVGNRMVSYNDLILPAYREGVWTAWQEVLRNHGRFEMEYEIAARTGETRWVWEQGEGVYDAQGQIVALEGFIADVTARKQAEGERERLTRAIEQSGETILITDADGRILYVNPAFTRVTGYAREEVLGQTPRVFQSGVHDREFYRAMWAVLKAGQTWEGQLVNKRKDGSLYTELAAISPVRDAAGRIVNFVAVKRDVTRELRAEEEKEALQTQLAHVQKLESLGRLAGGVAHDFNNVLQAILGYVEIAIEQVPPDQPLHADLKEIQKAAARSTSLTRQLQAFARKQAAAPRTLDLNEAVAGMSGMLRRLLGEGVQLIWKPGRDAGLVRIDPSQLDQIVTNLCINARDALGPAAGRIEIETSRADVPAAPAGAAGTATLKPGAYAVLTVRDNGTGMKPDVVAHIFEPFFTTKPVGKGTGLGLSTVYGTAQQYGGDVRVESRPGHGSTFTIYLPRLDAPAADAAETDPAHADPPTRKHETILLVEDEEIILRTTKRILESLGYRVLATPSPQDALRLAAEAGPHLDLLVTDVIMGGMNGPDLVRHLRETRPHLPCLYMSGYTAHLLAEQGIQDGAHFIQKPFNRHALATKVREILAP